MILLDAKRNIKLHSVAHRFMLCLSFTLIGTKTVRDAALVMLKNLKVDSKLVGLAVCSLNEFMRSRLYLC